LLLLLFPPLFLSISFLFFFFFTPAVTPLFERPDNPFFPVSPQRCTSKSAIAVRPFFGLIFSTVLHASRPVFHVLSFFPLVSVSDLLHMLNQICRYKVPFAPLSPVLEVFSPVQLLPPPFFPNTPTLAFGEERSGSFFRYLPPLCYELFIRRQQVVRHAPFVGPVRFLVFPTSPLTYVFSACGMCSVNSPFFVSPCSFFPSLRVNTLQAHGSRPSFLPFSRIILLAGWLVGRQPPFPSFPYPFPRF